MAINEVNQDYDNPAKQEWRKHTHSILTPDISPILVDEYGNYKHKLVELVAWEAKTFSHVLSTGKITENKLIGINDNLDIIKSCEAVFPKATFIHCDLDKFSISYNKGDIGIINFDSCNAGFGPAFEKSFRLILIQVVKSIENIGECMLVVNVDGSKTYRGKASKRTEDADNMTKAKMTMCDTINKILQSHPHKSINKVSIFPENIYQYKQTNKSSTMLSGYILFR